MKRKITIDWADGHRRSAWDCPVHRALKKHGFAVMSVSPHEIDFLMEGLTAVVETSPGLKSAIKVFDKGFHYPALVEFYIDTDTLKLRDV